MRRIIEKALLAMFSSLQRPSRRSTPSIFGLENRTLLSGQGTQRALVEPVHSLVAGGGSRMPEAVKKPNKQAAFVAGLYVKYYHREPEPAELSYALANWPEV